MTNALEIRRLNDAFRSSLDGSGKRFLTAGIAALPFLDQAAIMTKVMTHSLFPKGDDPYGEHDFGAFDHAGQQVFWKIDYYGLSEDYGSEDPADPAKTTRVLTVMLADEY